MASYNRVILIGNVTRDIEVRYTPGGTAVADVGIAANDKRKTANGEWVEEATFVDCTVFGNTAENASKYLSKGSPVMFEGRLKLESWETQDGQNRSKLKVIVERMQFLGGNRNGEGGGGSRGGGQYQGGQSQGRGRSRTDDEYSQDPHDYGSPPSNSYAEPPAAGGSGDSRPGDDIPF